MAETKYLHIGCGGNILPPPFVNLDSREISNIDIMSSANFVYFFRVSEDNEVKIPSEGLGVCW